MGCLSWTYDWRTKFELCGVWSTSGGHKRPYRRRFRPEPSPHIGRSPADASTGSSSSNPLHPSNSLQTSTASIWTTCSTSTLISSINPPQFQPIVSLSTLNSPVRFKIDLNHLNFTNPIPTNFSSTDWNVQSQTVLNQYIERNSIQSDAQSQSKALHSLKTKNGERINGSTNVEHVGEKNLVLPYETGQIKFYSNSNEWQCGKFGHPRAPNSEMNTNRIELNRIEPS